MKQYTIVIEYSERGTVGHKATHADTEKEGLRLLREYDSAIQLYHGDKLIKVKDKNGTIRDPKMVCRLE